MSTVIWRLTAVVGRFVYNVVYDNIIPVEWRSSSFLPLLSFRATHVSPMRRCYTRALRGFCFHSHHLSLLQHFTKVVARGRSAFCVICVLVVSVAFPSRLYALLTTMTWLCHVLTLRAVVHAVRYGTCCRLILTTETLSVKTSNRALRLGYLCKPTYRRHLWELLFKWRFTNIRFHWLIAWSSRPIESIHVMLHTQIT